MNNYEKERHKIISKAISELYTRKEIAKIFAKAKLTLKNSTTRFMTPAEIIRTERKMATRSTM